MRGTSSGMPSFRGLGSMDLSRILGMLSKRSIENSVQTVNAVSNHILAASETPRVAGPLSRNSAANGWKGQQFENWNGNKVLAHATGNKDPTRRKQATTWPALWASIQEGLEHISDAVCRIDPVDMVETWRRALGHRAARRTRLRCVRPRLPCSTYVASSSVRAPVDRF